MYQDKEYSAYKRRIYLQTGLILALALSLVVNTFVLFAGALFYNEFCVWNTRVGLERFNSLRAAFVKGKENKHWEDVSVWSPFGYELKGTYLPNPNPTDKTVIFLHGITANRLMGLWYASIYLDEGFNVLIYDARAHGESGGLSTTWGYYEKYDLDRWVGWVKERQPDGIIGVHGVSMGAATALEHAGINETNKNVKFYVADSAYADLEDLLMLQIDATVQFHNSLWVTALLKYSSAVAYSMSRFYYEQVSPVRAVQHATTPILYLHGEADLLVPVQMCRQLYDNTKGYREMHTFPKVGHAMAVFERKQQYRTLVHDFIHKALEQE